jgi:ferrous iron transport protein A
MNLNKEMATIAGMQKGQKGIIRDVDLDRIPLKLLEMGCLPGNEVTLIQVAPFNDPLYLDINGSHLAIRKDVAAQIYIDLC